MPNVESVYRLRLGYSDVKNTGYSLSYNNTDISFAADGTATVTTYQLDGNGNKQLDADGNRVENESTISVGGKTFLATYSGNSNRIDLLPGIPGEKTITDANTTQVELSFAKVDVKGNAMAGCEMTLTSPNGYSKTWTSDADPEKLTGLAAGDYTLTEKSMTGYAPVSISLSLIHISEPTRPY